MIDQNDILAALQNGEDPEAIAQKFADALNGAITAKKEMEEAVAAKEAETAAKRDMMMGILMKVNDFINKYYPEMHSDELTDVETCDAIVEACDQAYNEVMKLRPVVKNLEKLGQSIAAEQPKKGAEKKIKEDPLFTFLRENGLL